MHTCRLFLALEIDPDALKQIILISQELKQILSEYPLRWVKPETQHITLKFLGDIDPSKLDAIDRALKSNHHEMPECSASLGGLGAYPHLAQPRVIWVGVHPNEKMIKMDQSLEKSLSPLGFDVDHKGFFPHITLVRISDQITMYEKKAIGKLLGTLDIPAFSELRFSSITLFKSDLQRSGPIYTKVYSYPLNHNLC